MLTRRNEVEISEPRGACPTNDKTANTKLNTGNRLPYLLTVPGKAKIRVRRQYNKAILNRNVAHNSAYSNLLDRTELS